MKQCYKLLKKRKVRIQATGESETGIDALEDCRLLRRKQTWGVVPPKHEFGDHESLGYIMTHNTFLLAFSTA